jgi:hypothetical protein
LLFLSGSAAAAVARRWGPLAEWFSHDTPLVVATSRIPDAISVALAAATLRLEHARDPAGALDLLEGSPDPRWIAKAERLMAESHRADRQTENERRVLEGFAARHNAHPLVPKARRRLEAPDRGDRDAE